ncbi:hypothetical protein FGO68_gene8270 [Halteria grandinella]|uniref:Amino acid transporter transmembrane domain-containing protein n=1 Tax=Halteria grandinella TaxID=5974 RepID=A0A8J8T4Q7_HALGN|nr:hypothetical protein FGO68_gene8270 [Halteria grandinella]
MFALFFCGFPLINHFLRSFIFEFLFKGRIITTKIFQSVNIIGLLVPTLITMFYPKIGSFLASIGAVAGLFIIYLLPITSHLKKYHTEIYDPEHSLDSSDHQSDISSADTDAKKVIDRESQNNSTVSINASPIILSDDSIANKLKSFYWECFTHGLIIIYGIVILIFTFYNPLQKTQE